MRNRLKRVSHSCRARSSCLSENHKSQVLDALQCAETAKNRFSRGTCLARVRGILGIAGEDAGISPEQCTTLSLDMPLLEDTVDDSGNNHTAQVHGDAYIADGAHFDGEGDYMTVNSFQYGASADFTIGMWLTKESCTGISRMKSVSLVPISVSARELNCAPFVLAASIYEYLFSQSKYPGLPSVAHPGPGSKNPVPANPNINMYIGCEGAPAALASNPNLCVLRG